MTQTLTTERLKDLTFHHSKLISPASREEAAAMARELLANREAQPVAYTEQCEISNMQATGLYLRGFPDNAQGRNIGLFTAPPAPAVTSELLEAMDEVIRISDRDHDAWNRAKEAIAICRAAMLSAEPTQGEKQ